MRDVSVEPGIGWGFTLASDNMVLNLILSKISTERFAVSDFVKWASKGPLRYILVFGVGIYGTFLGLLMTGWFFFTGHLHHVIRVVLTFGVSWITGILFGLCLWLFMVRPLKGQSDDTAAPRR